MLEPYLVVVPPLACASSFAPVVQKSLPMLDPAPVLERIVTRREGVERVAGRTQSALSWERVALAREPRRGGGSFV